jgi:hypothetical protein
MLEVNVEYALILMGLRTGTYMFVYICTHALFLSKIIRSKKCIE